MRVSPIDVGQVQPQERCLTVRLVHGRNAAGRPKNVRHVGIGRYADGIRNIQPELTHAVVERQIGNGCAGPVAAQVDGQTAHAPGNLQLPRARVADTFESDLAHAAVHAHAVRPARERLAEVEPVLAHGELGVQVRQGQASEIGPRLPGAQLERQCDRHVFRNADGECVVRPVVSAKGAADQPHEERVHGAQSDHRSRSSRLARGRVLLGQLVVRLRVGPVHLDARARRARTDLELAFLQLDLHSQRPIGVPRRRGHRGRILRRDGPCDRFGGRLAQPLGGGSCPDESGGGQGG